MTSRRSSFLLAVAAAVTTVATYLTALGNGFVNWDDELYIVKNYHIRSLGGSFFRWAFATFYAANWHPLTWISHALDYALWGLNPLGHHLTNILLHGLNTFLVVLLMTKLLTVYREKTGVSFPDEKGTLIAAGVTGLLFGIHPIHVESVAWVAERKDLLCAFFYLLSILSYVKHAREQKGKGLPFFRRSYLLALCFFLLALLSKPMAVSLPLVLLILDWHPFRRIASWKDLWSAVIEKLPFFVLAAVSSVVTVSAQKEAGALMPLDFYPLPLRLLVASRSLMVYLEKMAWPAVLSPYYAYPKTASLWAPGYLVPVLAAGAVTVAALLASRRLPLFLAAWAAYAVILLPVLGIVQVGNQAMADRYAYLPSLGPFFLAGLGTSWAWTRAGALQSGSAAARGSLALVGLAVAVVLCFLTIRQIGVWKDDISLWTTVIERDPVGVPIAYNNRGLAYGVAGDDARAFSDFTTAILLDPRNYAAFLAYVNRGTLYKDRGDVDRARADYDMAIVLDPVNPSAYYNRGWLNVETGHPAEGITDYSKAIELDPAYSEAYNNRGVAYEDAGRLAEALADYDHAIRINPYDYLAYANRGVVLAKTGRDAEAMESFTKALDLNSGCAVAYAGRAELYDKMGDTRRAAADREKARSLGGKGGAR